MNDNITLYILDDHPLVLDGLKSRLDEEPGLEVLRTFTDPVEFLTETALLRPDVVLMDISLPQMDGLR